jgi:hypothetical protein
LNHIESTGSINYKKNFGECTPSAAGIKESQKAIRPFAPGGRSIGADGNGRVKQIDLDFLVEPKSAGFKVKNWNEESRTVWKLNKSLITFTCLDLNLISIDKLFKFQGSLN